MKNWEHEGFYTGQGPGAFTVETKGLKELDKALKLLPGELQEKCIENALKAGGKEIIPAIQRNIISNTGGLRKSITQRTNRKRGTNCLVQIGAWLPTAKYYSKGGKFTFDKAWYAHMVEWGTRAHDAQSTVFRQIQASKKGYKKPMMKFKSWRFGWRTKESVRGIRAQRPFTRGFDEKRSEFLLKFEEYIRKYLDKYYKKHLYYRGQ